LRIPQSWIEGACRGYQISTFILRHQQVASCQMVGSSIHIFLERWARAVNHPLCAGAFKVNGTISQGITVAVAFSVHVSPVANFDLLETLSDLTS